MNRPPWTILDVEAVGACSALFRCRFSGHSSRRECKYALVLSAVARDSGSRAWSADLAAC